MKIIEIKTQDIRFPTSKDNLGTDAVHVDCDYSATYVTIFTDQKDLTGIGLTFTIGKGNDLCCTVIEYFKEFIICLLYTSPSPRDGLLSRMPSSA